MTLVPLLFALATISDPCAAAERSGELRTAIACYHERLSGQAVPRERAEILTRLAWLHWSLAEFDQSLARFREVLTVSREIGDRTLEAGTVNYIGLLYQMVGEPAIALEYDQRALAMATELGDRKLLGIVYYQLGWVHFVTKDYAAAIKYYNQSLAARRDAGDRNGEGITLLGLGMTYSSLGQYDKALAAEQEALPLVRLYSAPHVEADALDHIGLALTFLHRPEEAIPRHQRALAIRTASGAYWTKPFSLSSLARAQRELGLTAEAAKSMSEVIGILESGRRNLSSRRFRGSLMAGLWGHYARYIGLLMELHEEDAAFSASERGRARLTLDAVQETLASKGGSLVAREEALRDEIDRLQRKRDQDPSPSPSPRVRGEGQGEGLENELKEIEKKISLEYPNLAAARNAEPLTASEIRSELLDDDSAVLEYFLGPEKSFVWILTKRGIDAQELPPRPEIEREAVRLHELLAAGDQRSKRHETDLALRRLSSMILPKLPAVRRLIIVPDGPLFYIPFAAFSNGGRMLLDRYEISMAPSASALVLLKRAAQARVAADAAVAVFADPVFRSDDPRVRGRRARAAAAPDPDLVRSAKEAGLRELARLPATRAEAENIARVARGGTRKALDFEASRRTVMHDDLSRYQIVHFATHALVNTQHPELSGIVLSLVDERGAPVDGFIRVHDLYSFRGAANLVVLSACRTAVGKELRGEGIVGLVNGFMNAGSARIVASSWNVKDQPTAELMQRFYREMFVNSLPPAAALRAAQQSMRSDERWQAPYYWGAFALYGLP